MGLWVSTRYSVGGHRFTFLDKCNLEVPCIIQNKGLITLHYWGLGFHIPIRVSHKFGASYENPYPQTHPCPNLKYYARVSRSSRPSPWFYSGFMVYYIFIYYISPYISFTVCPGRPDPHQPLDWVLGYRRGHLRDPARRSCGPARLSGKNRFYAIRTQQIGHATFNTSQHVSHQSPHAPRVCRGTILPILGMYSILRRNFICPYNL